MYLETVTVLNAVNRLYKICECIFSVSVIGVVLLVISIIIFVIIVVIIIIIIFIVIIPSSSLSLLQFYISRLIPTVIKQDFKEQLAEHEEADLKTF